MSHGKHSEAVYAIGTITAVVTGIYFSGHYAYVLFHGLVEIVSVAIAFAMFVLVWNTRAYLANNYLRLLGIGYVFSALIDLFHTFAFQGMTVFTGYGENLAPQLWLGARYLQTVTLVVAPLVIIRSLDNRIVFGGYAAAVVVLLTVIYSGHFPDCIVAGKGLTPFKKGSEYVISGFLIVSLYLLSRKRGHFSDRIYWLLVASVSCTIVSELCFTAFVSMYDFSNKLGHIAKLVSFYLVYRAILVTGLKEPFELIFRDLKQSEELLMQQREFSRCLLDSMADGVVACDADGTLTLFNRTAREWHGMDPMRLPREEWARYYDLFRADGATPLPTEEIPLAMAFNGEAVLDAGMAIVAAGQAPRFILANGSLITDAAGQKLGAVVVMRDITAFRRLEQELRQTNEELERRVEERTSELRKTARVLYEAQRIAQVGSWELDLLTNHLTWSNEIYRIFEIDPKAFGASYEAFLQAVHPDDREAVNAAYTSSVRTRVPYSIDHRLLLPEGREKHVHEQCETFYEGDKPIRSVGTVQDITERKRVEDALRRLNRELRAISNCNQALMKAEDEQTLLNEVCRIICDEAGYRMAWVGYAGDDTVKNIRLVAQAGFDDGYFDRAGLTWADTERGRGPAGGAIRSGKTDYSQDIATDPRMAPWREDALQRGYRSAIALPLKGENARVFGVFLIYSSGTDAFTPDEIRLMEELAGDLAFGITVLRTRAELRRAETVAHARLRMLESAYTADCTLDDTLRLMLDEIEAQTESRIGFYCFLDEDQQTLSLQIWSTNTLATMCSAEGKGLHQPVKNAGVWADCVRERRPVIHNDYASLPNRRGMPEGHAAVLRELVVPVFRGPRIVAIIGVGNKPGEYDETDVRIVSLLGDLSWEIVIRKQAEERLRQSEIRLSEAQRIAHIGYWDRDIAASRITLAEEACRIFGISTREPVMDLDQWQETWLQLIHPEDRERTGRAASDALSGVSRYNVEYRIVRSSGDVRHVHSVGNVIRDETGRPIRMRGMMQDITEQKLVEERLRKLTEELELRVQERTAALEEANVRLRELDRLKNMFIASMSHELRTPLNSAIGYSRILQNEWAGPLNEEQKEHLATVLKSCKHLLSLINDVIDVSRIEAGMVEAQPTEFDVCDVISEAVTSCEADIDGKGIELEVRAIHQTMHTDRTRLLQCLLNLVTNAVKYTEKGAITIGAELADNGTLLELSVADTGIGIEEENMRKLFSPFVRLASPLTAVVPGTGLGLYLTRKLVTEVLRGTITVQSVHDKGSVFVLAVPVTLPYPTVPP